jgi:hypothetical protein
LARVWPGAPSAGVVILDHGEGALIVEPQVAFPVEGKAADEAGVAIARRGDARLDVDEMCGRERTEAGVVELRRSVSRRCRRAVVADPERSRDVEGQAFGIAERGTRAEIHRVPDAIGGAGVGAHAYQALTAVVAHPQASLRVELEAGGNVEAGVLQQHRDRTAAVCKARKRQLQDAMRGTEVALRDIGVVSEEGEVEVVAGGVAGRRDDGFRHGVGQQGDLVGVETQQAIRSTAVDDPQLAVRCERDRVRIGVGGQGRNIREQETPGTASVYPNGTASPLGELRHEQQFGLDNGQRGRRRRGEAGAADGIAQRQRDGLALLGKRVRHQRHQQQLVGRIAIGPGERRGAGGVVVRCGGAGIAGGDVDRYRAHAAIHALHRDHRVAAILGRAEICAGEAQFARSPGCRAFESVDEDPRLGRDQGDVVQIEGRLGAVAFDLDVEPLESTRKRWRELGEAHFHRAPLVRRDTASGDEAVQRHVVRQGRSEVAVDLQPQLLRAGGAAMHLEAQSGVLRGVEAAQLVRERDRAIAAAGEGNRGRAGACRGGVGEVDRAVVRVAGHEIVAQGIVVDREILR